MPETGPLIIDCDTGRDDALAIWLALGLGLPLAGVVTSYGNTVLANVTDNTARVLSLAGRDDIPLLPGAEEPSRLHTGYKHTVKSRQAISGNGLCNLDLPRSHRDIPAALPEKGLARAILELAEAHGPLDYVIIGPATNFAAVCRHEGGAVRQAVRRVTMMGGRLDELWDETPEADFNLVCDPFAVQEILKQGFEIGFVPLNATWPIALDLEDIELLDAGTPVSRTARALMISHCRHFAPEPVFRFHDPSVILALLEPEGFTGRRLDIVCDETGPDFARLIDSADGFPCRIYQTGGQRQRHFLSRILQTLELT